jgi:hypothetical protein
MVKSILDTDIFSEYLKGHNPVVIGHAARYAHEHRVFSFTSVTVYEIFGISTLDDKSHYSSSDMTGQRVCN